MAIGSNIPRQRWASPPPSHPPPQGNLNQVAQIISDELLHGKEALSEELKPVVGQTRHLPQKELTQALVAKLEAQAQQPYTFISTPITGGPRLMAFLEHTGIHELKFGLPVMNEEQRKQYFDEVVLPNKQHADEVTANLRSQGQAVLESAGTERIPDWTNEDFNRHWMGVVRETKPLEQLVVCDGWQFSFGTLLELRSAMDRGVKIEDEHGQTIDKGRALGEVQAAVGEARQHGLDYSVLPVVLTGPDVQTGPMSL